MNKKFILIILVFTVTVPGFFLFSYWFLGVFSGVTQSDVKNFSTTFYGIEHQGDYNKTGEGVVKTMRLLESYAFPCAPILLYRDNAITVGKIYLKSVGGCITDNNLPAHVVKALNNAKMLRYDVRIETGYRFATYAQTAIALRKVWPEIARLTDKGDELKFPLVQLVKPTGDNEFLIARGAINRSP